MGETQKVNLGPSKELVALPYLASCNMNHIVGSCNRMFLQITGNPGLQELLEEIFR